MVFQEAQTAQLGYPRSLTRDRLSGEKVRHYKPIAFRVQMRENPGVALVIGLR